MLGSMIWHNMHTKSKIRNHRSNLHDRINTVDHVYFVIEFQTQYLSTGQRLLLLIIVDWRFFQSCSSHIDCSTSTGCPHETLNLIDLLGVLAPCRDHLMAEWTSSSDPADSSRGEDVRRIKMEEESEEWKLLFHSFFPLSQNPHM